MPNEERHLPPQWRRSAIAALSVPVRRFAKKVKWLCLLPRVVLEQSVGLRAQPRVAISHATPTAPQVVANYTRGLVLFGRPNARLAAFQWRSVPTRAVVTPETAKVPRTVRIIQRRTDLKVLFDRDFEAVLHACMRTRADWIWLTPALNDVYREVYKLGFIATVEVYHDDRLVGGLWGITVGRTLGAMSMFHREDHAGSLAMAALSDIVSSGGRWSLIDYGNMTPHFARYGAREVPEDQFCELVWQGLKQENR